MMRTVSIDGRELRMRATARIPFLYREFFNRDIFADIQGLMDGAAKKSINDTEVATTERAAWVLVLNAEPEQLEAARRTDTREAFELWLDGFENILTFFQAVYPVLDIWIENVSALATPKKNKERQSDR